MGLSRAWVPVSAVLLLFGLVPGMPNTLFLTGAFLSGLIAWFTSKRDGLNQIEEQPESKNEEENIGNIEIDEVSDNASISLDLGMV